MAMPVNIILVMYGILCILSYDFNKLIMLHIHMYVCTYLSLIFITNIEFLSVNRISVLSVCLSVWTIYPIVNSQKMSFYVMFIRFDTL